VAGPAAHEHPERSAIRHFASHVRLWLVAALGLWTDLESKQWAFSHVPGQQTVMDGVLSFKLSLNPGALFGLGAGLAPIFVGASVLALLFVLYLFSQSAPRHRGLHIALGLVLAGAIGNLHDRTQVMAYVVHTNNGQRDVGRLVDSGNKNRISIEDFWPSDRKPREYRKRDISPESGEQPAVRDFISIDARVFGRSVWPWIFNIADVWLVVGVGTLLVSFWRDGRRGGHGPSAGEGANGPPAPAPQE